MPTITVTGASFVFSKLPALTQAASFSLPSGELTKTKRAGLLLAEVGPHFSMSYSCLSVACGMGSGAKALCVRALSKSCSVVMFMRCRGVAEATIVECSALPSMT